MTRIFLKYDLDGDGRLDYSEFIRLVNFVPKTSSSSSAAGGAGAGGGSKDRVVSSQLRDETDALLDRIRRRLEDNLGSGAGSARRIKQTFEDIDIGSVEEALWST